ncbi:hypothetical protein D6D10_01268 [Aureobasidium pullulans]|uniref:Uncharacterized protein n=1 Tax=Aureobasidium pullulans TaxID=5580 RepID=A0A4S9F7G9_AURPU|nr:hypothetical protein D6D10_01268 [Aureobasidium pullulans]
MSFATPILGARRKTAALKTVFEEESDDEDYDETSPEVKDPEHGNSLEALESRSIALDATAPDAHATGDLSISDTHDQAELNRLSRLAVTTLGSSDESTESNADMAIVIDDQNPRGDTESEDEVIHQPSNERSSPYNVPERHGLSPVITQGEAAVGSNIDYTTTELDEIYNFPIYEDGINTLLEEIPIKSESSRALKQKRIDRLSDDRETGISLDSGYARILNSSIGRQSITADPDMVPEEERKLDFQGDGENVDGLLSVWRRGHKPDDAKARALDRRHARDELANWRYTFDSAPIDPEYARILGSAAPAIFPSTDTLNDRSSPEEWPRKVYGPGHDEDSAMTSPVGPTIDDETQAELLAIANETAEDVMSECSASDSHESSEDVMSEVATSERQRSLGSQRQYEPYSTSLVSENASPSPPVTHRSRDTSLIRSIKAGVKRALHEECFSYGGISKRQKRDDISPGGVQLDKPTQGYNLR